MTIAHRAHPRVHLARPQPTSSPPGRLRPLWQEALILVGLLVVYRVGRLFGDMDAVRGVHAGYRMLDIEHTLHLPREQSLQALVLHAPDLVRAANLYYATMHFGVIIAVLIWLHRRRPEAYLLLRRTIVAATAAGLLVQLLAPLAPPRMLAGFVDTGRLLGPSVYGSPSGDSVTNQFAAMPSLHVGWALSVALVLVVSGTSRWRWLWVLHPTITLFVVVVTGNHYWFDGVVGSALVVVAFGGARVRARRIVAAGQRHRTAVAA